MLSVEEAIQRIERTFFPLGAETVALDQGLGRVLAEALEARLTQPPADVSAMDGYAVRAADVDTLPAKLKIVQRIAPLLGLRPKPSPEDAVKLAGKTEPGTAGD